MPLIMKCDKCGLDVKVERMEEERKGFVFEYYCAKCGLKILEEIPKIGY